MGEDIKVSWLERSIELESEDALSPEFMGRTMYMILRKNRDAVVDLGTAEILAECSPTRERVIDNYYSRLAKIAGIALTGENSQLQTLHEAWQIAKEHLEHEHEKARGLYSDASYSLRAC